MTLPTPRSIIESLEALFSDKSKWTANAFARDAEGQATSARSPDATCWCLMGGINKITDPLYPTVRAATNEEIGAIAELQTDIYDLLADHCPADLYKPGETPAYGSAKLVALNDRLGYDAVISTIRAAKAELIA